MRIAIPSWLKLAEAVAFAVLVGVYIWRWQLERPGSWIVFPIWLILSFAIHRDTPKTLGWRADNFLPAMHRAAKIFGVFIALLLAIAVLLGTKQGLPMNFLEPRRFFAYFAFCTLQQVALQSVVMNRLLAALRNEIFAALLAGGMFAALHWPNPVLVPLTFIGGTAMCWMFARDRNILPLALGQTILGLLVWWAFPVAWHHGMRVGPGFYSFPLR